MTRPRLSISFSGGRSSAVMLHLTYAKAVKAGREVVVTFANTGAEHPATLDFVRDVTTHWGIPIVWIEAEINPTFGVGPRARVVDYTTASRDGKPFEDAVAKYGVFSPAMPQCTSRLKIEPMRAYLRDALRWDKNTYSTAIGIRADEMDRVNLPALESGELAYPLIDAGYTKDMVAAYMRRQRFDLKLPGDHYGNCVTCWKKSWRKLYTIAQDDPASFALFDRLEKQYGAHKRNTPATFFRGSRSADDVVRAAMAERFERYSDSAQLTMWDAMLDIGSGCEASCEIDNAGGDP